MKKLLVLTVSVLIVVVCARALPVLGFESPLPCQVGSYAPDCPFPPPPPPCTPEYNCYPNDSTIPTDGFREFGQ